MGLAEASQLVPISATAGNEIERAIRIVIAEAADLLATPADLVDDDLARELVLRVHSIMRRQACALENMQKLASAVWKLLSHCPACGSRIMAMLDEAGPWIRRRRKERGHPSIPTGLGERFRDWRELSEIVEDQLDSLQKKIQSAVSSELSKYEEVCALQAELLREKDPARSKSNESLTAALRWAQSQLGRLAETGWPAHADTHSKDLELPIAQHYKYQRSKAPWLFASYRLPNSVITAIFVALLLRTGWNIESVGSITRSQIRIVGRKLVIQGFKGKTDDDTPAAEIPASARPYYQAVNLLLWNQQQLKDLDLIPRDEDRLWFGWQRDAFKLTIDPVSRFRFGHFCSTAGIEKIRPKDIRPLRASLAYLTHRDLESVRVLLGHKSLSMSELYLKETLFFRMNEANIHQFQRRIEATISYRFLPEELLQKQYISKQDIDATLLPTGDGGYCKEPSGRPDRAPTKSPCPGLECQSGSTCPNYRLLVDECSIELALRTLRMYQSRIDYIADRSPEQLHGIHIPRLLYIKVLLDIVNEQRPDLLRSAKARLS